MYVLTKVLLADHDCALKYLAELSLEGFNLFRGQRKKWPILPSLFRGTRPERVLAESRLQRFLEWANDTSHLANLSATQLLAIAQHYGIPTSLIDITRSYSAAMFFATYDAETDSTSTPTVFAWRRSALEKLPSLEIVELVVPNLWRLEAQEGLFLKFKNEGELNLAASDTYEIEIPTKGIGSPYSANTFYPERKSGLESLLDLYHHRESGYQRRAEFEELAQRDTRFILLPYSCPDGWYASAFSDTKIAVKIDHDLVNRWRISTRRPNPTVERDNSRVIVINGEAIGLGSKIGDALDRFGSGTKYPTFELIVSEEAVINRKLSQIFNWVFDGLVAFPFSRESRLHSLVNSFHLLRATPLDLDLSKAKRELRALFGDCCTVRLAPENGLSSLASVSIRGLDDAVSRTALNSLRPFFRRLIGGRTREITCLCTNPALVFDFSRFVPLFAKQLIPVQALEHAQLCSANDWEPSAHIPWGVIFDPFSLSYFSVVDYEQKYPDVNSEIEDQEFVVIFRGMEASDIREDVISAARSGVSRWLRLHGMPDNPQEIRDNSEAIELLRVFYSENGMGILAAQGRYSQNDQGQVFFSPGLGAFEVWLLVQRIGPDENAGSKWGAICSRFETDWINSKQVVADLALEFRR